MREEGTGTQRAWWLSFGTARVNLEVTLEAWGCSRRSGRQGVISEQAGSPVGCGKELAFLGIQGAGCCSTRFAVPGFPACPLQCGVKAGWSPVLLLEEQQRCIVSCIPSRSEAAGGHPALPSSLCRPEPAVAPGASSPGERDAGTSRCRGRVRVALVTCCAWEPIKGFSSCCVQVVMSESAHVTCLCVLQAICASVII